MSARPFLLTFLILAVFSGFIRGQVLLQIYPDSVSRWSLYQNDEFNGEQLNNDSWRIGFPWSRAILSQKTYVIDDNVKLGNGNLCLQLQKIDSVIQLHSSDIDSNYFRKHPLEFDQNKFRFQFLGSLLWSKEKYAYGYYELKFKAPIGQGIWPAFWLYGGNPNYEIDFFELKGEKESSVHVDLHCPTGCQDYKKGAFGYRRAWGHWVETTSKLNESFNVIGVSWSAIGMIWYLNGEVIATATHQFDMPMNLSIGTGVAMPNGPFKPGINSETPFPNNFFVDYLRIYKYGNTDVPKEIIPAFDSTGSKLDFAAARKRRKLKRGSVKAKQVTLSMIPAYQNNLQLRVLGLKNRSLDIFFMDQAGNLILARTIQENLETIIEFKKDLRSVQVLIKTAEQTIYENIRL